MVNFADLKKSRKSQMEKLNAELAKLNSKESPADAEKELYWKATIDKAGNSYCVIRFLPAPAGEDMPFVRYWDHAFKGPTGKWYIEKSLTSLGMGTPDPVSESNKVLWDSGIPANKELVSGNPAKKIPGRKRRLHYVANVYVVTDKGNPENEGKVFLYKFGKKIFDKLNDCLHPEFEDQDPMNPYDLWEGANFIMRIRTVGGYVNYDKCEFDKPAALASDEEMEEIWKQAHSLAAIIDPKNFKSYEQLKKRLTEVLAVSASVTEEDAEGMVEEEAPRMKTTPARPAPRDDTPPFDTDDDDDANVSFFAKLAEED